MVDVVPSCSPAFALQSPVFQMIFPHAQMMTKLVKVSDNHQFGEFIAILTALLPDSGQKSLICGTDRQ
jgi:hypothetical protein